MKMRRSFSMCAGFRLPQRPARSLADQALMDPIRPAKEEVAAEDDGFAPPGASSSSADRNTTRPKLPEDTTELFQPTDEDGERITYTPCILRSATVNFDDAKRKISGKSIVTLVNRSTSRSKKCSGTSSWTSRRTTTSPSSTPSPKKTPPYADLPGPALKSSTYTSIKQGLRGLGLCQSHARSLLQPAFGGLFEPRRETGRIQSPQSPKPPASNAMPPSKNSARKPPSCEVFGGQSRQSRAQSGNAEGPGQQRHHEHRRLHRRRHPGCHLWSQKRHHSRKQQHHRAPAES
jgi:hypothetical protein